MKKLLLVAIGVAAAAMGASAEETDSISSYCRIPDRHVVFGGNDRQLHTRVLDALYDRSDLQFQDPSVPRYLLIDKEGSTAFGIGGYVEGVVMADFRGAIDDNGFETSKIPVPGNYDTRSRMNADVSHTTIFMKLVRNTPWGILNAYVQSNFTGDNGGYGFRIKQAYISVGNVLAGLANSTFVDPASQIPTIDYQVSPGEIDVKNVLVRYRYVPTARWSMALGVELPKATVTPLDGHSAGMNQKVPDIPAYIQYSWDGGDSHLRLSGILRNLEYRDLVTATNRHVTGYGAQLSGTAMAGPQVRFYYSAAFGRGISHYVNDLEGEGFDLVASADDAGRMIAPKTLGAVAGVRYDITPRLFVSSAYSFNRLYDQAQLGGDTYRMGQYIVANAFYTPIEDLQLGIEYLHGRRSDVNRAANDANRINAMIKYSF